VYTQSSLNGAYYVKQANVKQARSPTCGKKAQKRRMVLVWYGLLTIDENYSFPTNKLFLMLLFSYQKFYLKYIWMHLKAGLG
jgi:hypothetical protein